MFYNFFALNTIESFDKLDAAQITDMSHMFDSCTSLPTLDLSNNFITSNVTDMSYMFEDCTSLVTIIVSEDFDVTNVTNSTDMFNNCTSIVGDNDTTYDNAHVDKMYARIDGGPDSTTPGYFIYTPNKVYEEFTYRL